MSAILNFLSKMEIESEFCFDPNWNAREAHEIWVKQSKTNDSAFVLMPGRWKKTKFPIIKMYYDTEIKQSYFAVCIWALKTSQTDQVISSVIADTLTEANIKIPQILPLGIFGKDATTMMDIFCGGDHQKSSRDKTSASGLILKLNTQLKKMDTVFLHSAVNIPSKSSSPGSSRAEKPPVPEDDYNDYLKSLEGKIPTEESLMDIDLDEYPVLMRLLTEHVTQLKLDPDTGVLLYNRRRAIDSKSFWLPVSDLFTSNQTQKLYEQTISDPKLAHLAALERQMTDEREEALRGFDDTDF